MRTFEFLFPIHAYKTITAEGETEDEAREHAGRLLDKLDFGNLEDVYVEDPIETEEIEGGN